jgi:hypothetical protein
VYVAEIDGEQKRIYAVDIKPGVRRVQSEHKEAKVRRPEGDE